MGHPDYRFSLSDLTCLVLVAAMALAPLSAGINALGQASCMAVIGIFGVAAAGALTRRRNDKVFRLGFAGCGSIILMVAGWLHVPAVYGRPDFGRVYHAAFAIACGILGGLLARRLAATAGKAEERASAHPLSL